MRNPVLSAVILVTSLTTGLFALRDQLMKKAPEYGPEYASEASVNNVAPVQTATYSADSAYIRRERDGHYWAQATVNGVPVRFLVDTGATTVVLTAADARKIGIDPDNLRYGATIQTASGRVNAGRTFLQRVSVDGLNVDGVEAIVLERGLEHSLLGMSFLGKLSRWEMTQDSIILRR